MMKRKLLLFCLVLAAFWLVAGVALATATDPIVCSIELDPNRLSGPGTINVTITISNSGDTFRLHKITFVKITIAGKSLKLYFALDPKDYANSTYPVQDVSAKNVYKDIPLVFKVKSELSMRRAKQLIADVMDKHGLEQGKIIAHNYAADLKDYVPTGSSKDDDDDED